mmetsp:Transcript_44115/g.110743  ORF Transcript_44115/g.110743 Transcript_44115/m.110743 type:complete len:215 (-) Transcript_44115:365-1009(-)
MRRLSALPTKPSCLGVRQLLDAGPCLARRQRRGAAARLRGLQAHHVVVLLVAKVGRGLGLVDPGVPQHRVRQVLLLDDKRPVPLVHDLDLVGGAQVDAVHLLVDLDAVHGVVALHALVEVVEVVHLAQVLHRHVGDVGDGQVGVQGGGELHRLGAGVLHGHDHAEGALAHLDLHDQLKREGVSLQLLLAGLQAQHRCVAGGDVHCPGAVACEAM